jgi:4,5-DOPA dioxygenase extradiol
MECEGGQNVLPSFFIAHGAPSLAIEEHAYTEFLRELGSVLPRPRAIVIFTAHWESKQQQISSAVHYDTIYDFSGFSEALYQIQYPASGDLTLSLEIQRLLLEEGIESSLNDQRGLDHGAWAPLHVMYPAADVPIVALSVNPNLTPEEHYRIGAALEPLRERDVLILGSGGTVHNLRKLDRHNENPQEWSVQFDEWLAEQLETWHVEALYDYENRAPHARDSVPTAEHFVPLFLSMGAVDQERKAQLLHLGYQLGTLSLSCWMFGDSELFKEESQLDDE